MINANVLMNCVFRLRAAMRMVDDLRSDVLEMRRYEKNLQLFPGRKGDLAALRGFVNLARERATTVGRDYNAAMQT
jgi:hypothetical protein